MLLLFNDPGACERSQLGSSTRSASHPIMISAHHRFRFTMISSISSTVVISLAEA